MIPLDMVGSDGSWRATIEGRTFRFTGGERVVIPVAEVLGPGRNQVLMNSHAPPANKSACSSTPNPAPPPAAATATA